MLSGLFSFQNRLTSHPPLSSRTLGFPLRFYQVIREMDATQYASLSKQELETIQEALDNDWKLPDGSECEVEATPDVVTISAGSAGVWVINRHSASKQIWFSSPISGPRKFFFSDSSQQWVDERDDTLSLNGLVKKEFKSVLGTDIDI